MGYVSFREGMFFLNTLGFLTNNRFTWDGMPKWCPQQGFSTSSPAYGSDKMLVLPMSFY